MIGSRTRTTIALAHRAQVQTVDHLHHEPRQMFLRQPLVDRGRHQEAGQAVSGAEVRHAAVSRRGRIVVTILAWNPRGVKSDRLLATPVPRGDLSYCSGRSIAAGEADP